MGNNGTVTLLRWMCEYMLQLNLNGLEQQIVCDLRPIVCKFVLFISKQKKNQSKTCAY